MSETKPDVNESEVEKVTVVRGIPCGRAFPHRESLLQGKMWLVNCVKGQLCDDCARTVQMLKAQHDRDKLLIGVLQETLDLSTELPVRLKLGSLIRILGGDNGNNESAR